MIERGKRKSCVGVVVSDKNNKTRQVSIDRIYRHRLYDRVIRGKRKFAVHDENNISKMGDTVKIMESRPFSKTKKWVLIKIMDKNETL